MTLDLRRAQVLLERMRGRRVLVVGDLMLDRYVTGTVSRISPEAPVPVVRIAGERSLPGGAANVARNIQELGGQATVAGVIGADGEGTMLRRLLRQAGVCTRRLVVAPQVPTTVKTRILAERQQVVRIDREATLPLTPVLEARLVHAARDAVTEVDAVILEDYAKGAVTQRVVNAVLTTARRRRIPVGLDPKNSALTFSWLTLATPNYKEALTAAGLPMPEVRPRPAEDPALQEAGRRLSRKWNVEVLLITLGADGMYLRDRRGRVSLLPTRAREVFDVTGAGDTVIATTVLALVAGAVPEEAAALANAAAGVVVGKLGAATCSPQELLRALDPPPSKKKAETL